MRTLNTITDPTYTKKVFDSLDIFFFKYLKDERDLPFIYLIFKLSLLFIPAAITAYTIDSNTWQWWTLAVLYAVALLWYTGPFTLMLHNTSHRPFFKRKYKLGNRFIPWILCPFMGQSPDTYFSHHIGMHHAENNLEPDLSSTMKYQRDSFIDYTKYYVYFLFLGVIQLIQYHQQKKKKKFLKQTIIGELTFMSIWIILALFNLKATLLVFILPTIIVRFAMMSGNWAQHAFIDAREPENNYRNSITCINNVYNKRCFNDGYHIGHHLKPHMHWTDMPQDFKKNIEHYIFNRAIVFEGIDYFIIWFWLMLKRYDILAKHFVNIGNTYQSEEEIIVMLKKRTQKIT